ncbi:hypothetical protein ACIGO6_10365 [Streptomyces sp. NPDC053750]|uniref:hypothetical protein n=1 Tax=Streptomyces sp. NPDC053750 TaxID=3365714 RepID=UPI0037D742B4
MRLESSPIPLHALRKEIGDEDFFAVLRGWQRKYAGTDAAVADFVAYAEKATGKQLDRLFDTWLCETSKPAVGPNGKSDQPSLKAAATKQPKSWKKLQAVQQGHRH